jgi:hypothetical protein
MLSSVIAGRRWYFATMSCACALMIVCSAASASEKKILYTVQPNPLGPGGDYPGNTALDATWAAQICNNGEMPLAIETEWTPILDPSNQDAETHLVAVSGTVSYNPEPSESGYCQHTGCPGQPVPCLSDSDCSATACNGTAGTCDLAQGPSCTGGSCNSPWTKPQTGSPISCVSDAQCAASSACGTGTCSALGRSRGDLVSTHPFGFDYDVAVAPDPAYRSLLAPGNVASYHIDANGAARPGFEDVVYPFLHATTPVDQKTRGWCSPSFDDRCSVDADCPSQNCEGNINGLGGSTDPVTLPGTLGMETDHDLLPEDYQPHDGDRTAAFGRWIVDCGHGDKTIDNTLVPGFHTEIHPPLLVTSGRSTGHGAFAANCSAEQTCSSMIGRPYLVSQYFGDGYFLKHLEHEAEKLGCLEITGPGFSIALHDYAGIPDCAAGLDPNCVCNSDAGCIACEALSCSALDTCVGVCPFFPPACGACAVSAPPLGLTCTTQLEERPGVSGLPFAGTPDMQYYVQPANDRLHPGDRMLVESHFTARHGVNVALSNGGDAAGVLVHVTMDPTTYVPAVRPPKQDWAWHDSRIEPLQVVLDTIALFIPLETPQALILQQGIFSDRYQAPQAPANDSSPATVFADQLDGTVQAAQTIDDSQPFPVSGRINVGWFRCDAGGPYGADCAGPRTSMMLDGGGSSDPDGKPLTYTWTGPFIGGTATGATPTVKFNGGGTFPVTLTVDNGTVSTSCTSSVTIRPAAVLQLGGGDVNATGSAGGVNGDVCVGPNGSLDVTGSQFVTGTIHLAPGDPLTKSGTGLIGPVLRNQDLSGRITDTIAAANDFAALLCTQTFTTWKGARVIVGAGGQNVICVGDVNLSGNSVVTLSGGANDTFVVNVTGKLKLTDSSKIVASGVPRSSIIYNVIGSGQQVVLSSASGGGAKCCSASLDGTLLAIRRAISFGPGLNNGEVISGQSISLGGGSSVH